MAGISMVPIYCDISVGGVSASTPRGGGNHVLSFNVDKVRGQAGTCSISLKVSRGQSNFSGGNITINAQGNTVFYGYVRSISISPCKENPSYVIMNVTGVDALIKLEGKKYTRRCRSVNGTWVGIEGVTREGIRSGKFAFLPSDANLSMSGGKLNKEDNTTKTRTYVSQPTAFEKLSTNVNSSGPFFRIQNVEAPSTPAAGLPASTSP